MSYNGLEFRNLFSRTGFVGDGPERSGIEEPLDYPRLSICGETGFSHDLRGSLGFGVASRKSSILGYQKEECVCLRFSKRTSVILEAWAIQITW